MIEVAGADTAIVNAVGNTMGNAWGLLVPLLSVYCKRRFDSYAPVFVTAGVISVTSALVFYKCARCHSRDELRALP